MGRISPSGAPLQAGVLCDRAVETALAPAVNNTLPAVVSTARAAMQCYAKLQSVQREQLSQALAAWVATDGRKLVADFLGDRSDLRHFEPVFLGVPSDGSRLIEYKHRTQWTAMCSRQAALVSHRSNLNKAILADWGARHEPIMHTRCPPIDDESCKPKRNQCFAKGVCSCGRDGARLAQLRQRFYARMKRVFHKESASRRDLVEKKAIVKLVGKRGAITDAWGQAEAECLGLAVEAIDVTIWWHVGCSSFSPYEATFRVLQFKKDEVQGGLRLLEFEVAARLGKNMGCNMSLWSGMLLVPCGLVLLWLGVENRYTLHLVV